MVYFKFIWILLFIVLASSANVIISNVDRIIKIKSPIVKIQSNVTLEYSKDVSDVDIVIEPMFFNHFSYINGYTDAQEPLEFVMENNGIKMNLNGKHRGATINFIIEIYLINVLKPVLNSIEPNEQQYLKLNISDVAYWPYDVKKQTTKVVFEEKQSKAILYGPFFNIVKFSTNEIPLVFPSNMNLMHITNLERTIELSQWGNIAVEETVSIENKGSGLKQPFSHLQKNEVRSKIVNHLSSWLPASATDIYYRDEIGNISTSVAEHHWDRTVLHLKFRYPLLGGWRIKYTVGYNIPSYAYMENNDDYFHLRMPLLNNIFDDMTIELMTVNIILPEGAENQVLQLPYPVANFGNETHYSYFDTSGRVKLTFKKKNLIESHIGDFDLNFVLRQYNLFRKPITFASVIYLGLLGFIITSRFHSSDKN